MGNGTSFSKIQIYDYIVSMTDSFMIGKILVICPPLSLSLSLSLSQQKKKFFQHKFLSFGRPLMKSPFLVVYQLSSTILILQFTKSWSVDCATIVITLPLQFIMA